MSRAAAPDGWILFALVLALVLPTQVTFLDGTLNILLLMLVSCLGLGWIWLRSRRPTKPVLPWAAAPAWMMAAYLLILWSCGIAGYQPLQSVSRYFLAGTLLFAAFNAFAGRSPYALILACRWLLIVIALAYLPGSHWQRDIFFTGDRYSFTFSHANVLGCLLVILFPLPVVHLWLKESDGLSKTVTVVSIVAAVFLAGVVQSRMAVGLIVAQGLVVSAIGLRIRLGWGLWRSVATAGTATILGLATLVVAFGGSWMQGKFGSLWKHGAPSREFLWRETSDTILDQPAQGLLGHGAGILFQISWEFPVDRYGFLGRGKADAFAHNQFLDWSLEGGLVGAICFLGFAGLLLWCLARSIRIAAGTDERMLRFSYLGSAVGMLLFGQVSIANSQAIMVGVGSMMMGAMLALARPDRAVSRISRAALPVLLAASLVAAALHFPAVVSDRLLLRGLRLTADPATARRAGPLLARSTDWNPRNAHAWYYRLVTAHNQGRRRGVREAYMHSEELVPNLLSARLAYAAHLAETSRPADALPILDRYLDSNTYDFTAHCQFLLYAGRADRPEDVARGLERLVVATISFTEAKGLPAPAFRRTSGPDGDVRWILEWGPGETRSSSRAELVDQLSSDLTGQLNRDISVIRDNAWQVLQQLGFAEKSKMR